MLTQLLIAASLAAAPAPCDDALYHKLDFWVGAWDVYDPNGKKYATQDVRRVVEGCGLTAEWNGPDGNRGLMLIGYDPVLKGWRAVYMSNQIPRESTIFVRFSDPDYSGAGVRITRDVTNRGAGERERMTFTPLDGGRMRQLLEVSHDSGASWTTVFNAEHRPRK
ncbi:MAG TPA: hypothetical protein VM100_00510 [Longimicrobiales bacterium]|nr:hypothetical protein [Longimicrobiales bacterium]